MARNNQRGRKNNNPEGHNQYSSGWKAPAKDSPMKTAAAAAAAVGAGVFLWSRRTEISGQINRLSDQITDWADDMRSNMPSRSDGEMAMADDSMGSSAIGSSRSTGSRAGRSTSSRTRRSSESASSGQSSTTGAGMNSGADGIAH